jgi:hypothetical protein
MIEDKFKETVKRERLDKERENRKDKEWLGKENNNIADPQYCCFLYPASGFLMASLSLKRGKSA